MNQPLRRATPEDLHLIRRWGEALYNVEKTFEPYADYNPDQFKDRDVQALQDPNALMLVVEDRSRPVGYLYAHLQPLPTYLTLQGKMCVLEVVYLEEGARGKGLADALILACVEWAKGKGAKRIVAGVYAENAASLRIFSRLEFEPHHITVMRSLSEG